MGKVSRNAVSCMIYCVVKGCCVVMIGGSANVVIFEILVFHVRI